MRAVLIDCGAPESCRPLTCTRRLADCPVANRPLAEIQAERLRAGGLALAESATAGESRLFVRGDAWLSTRDIARLSEADSSAALKSDSGEALAWGGTAVEPADGCTELAADTGSFLIRYPWDLLRVNELLVGALERDEIDGDVASGVTIDGHVRIGCGTRLLPGVYIEGNVVIGCDCKIGPNCYIRGSTSIGDGCHLGPAVEVKNAILMRGVSLGHLNYIGDSIVGENANLGAGTITANFRHDGCAHRSMVGDDLVDTGRLKFGAIIGDEVHTGIHTAIYPGRKIWPHVWTRPGTVVQHDLHDPANA